MPQFDFSNVFWPQLIWLTVIFAVLFFGVVLPTLPKLGRAVDARENKIQGDIEQAEAAKGQADATAAQTAAVDAQARETARATLADAKAKVAASVAKKLSAANDKVEEKLAASQAEIGKASAKAIMQIEAIATENAEAIVGKLSGVKLPASATGAAVKAALNKA
jgi:F-type H+-transporting ATPase subunit b